MASKVVVHFEANGMPLRVEVGPEDKVDGVILLPDGLREAFIKKNGLTSKRGLPPGVKVLDGNEVDVTAQALQSGFGPGVCYMIGLQVFCW